MTRSSLAKREPPRVAPSVEGADFDDTTERYPGKDAQRLREGVRAEGAFSESERATMAGQTEALESLRDLSRGERAAEVPTQAFLLTRRVAPPRPPMASPLRPDDTVRVRALRSTPHVWPWMLFWVAVAMVVGGASGILLAERLL